MGNKGPANLLTSLSEVFSKPAYLAATIIIFLGLLLFAIWFPNFNFLKHTTTTNTFTFSQKVGIISSTLAGIQTNFSPLSRTLTILVSLLFAINASFFIFYILRAASLNREAGIGISGFLLGVLGVGCASCGSVLLSGFFGAVATAGFLGAFPLKGQEFGFVAVILIAVSIYLLGQKISNPLVCRRKPMKLKSLLSKFPPWSETGAGDHVSR